MISIPFFDDHYPIKTFISGIKDIPSSIKENDRDMSLRDQSFKDFLNIPVNRIIYADQTHSANVFAISGDYPEGRLLNINEELTVKHKGGYDSIVTDLPNVLICVHTADCLPLLFYDPVEKVSAIVHAGWRGLCGGIITDTIKVMEDHFNSKAENTVSALSIGICGSCYEVGDDVYECLAKRHLSNDPKDFLRKRPNGKYDLDIKKAAARELKNLGISPENIYDINICTYENKDYASYRRDGKTTAISQNVTGIIMR
ncbi:MAG: peptidoglycan editing factor PgeF [Lachnospiraceae bacterium]|nr:peptidoglycan editing factor PgeF [Lachnospiraceae bacterium]